MRSTAYLRSHVSPILFAITALRTEFSLAVSSTATCFSPDGEIASGNFPCFLGQDISACCGVGDLCLSTGLCEPPDSTGASDIIRGTCTDSTWTSASCPQYCLQSDAGGTNLISCQNVTNNDQDFCCDHTNGCCDSGIGRFRVGAEATIVATIGPTGVPVTIQQSIANSPSSSIQASFESSTPPSVISSTTSSITSLSAAPAASTSTTMTNIAAPVSSNNATSIGVGVGVGVGVCILVVLGFLLFRYRSKRKLAPRQANQSEPFMEQNNVVYDNDGHVKASHVPQTRSELEGMPRAELDSLSKPAELCS